MRGLLELVRQRHSAREPYDPHRPVGGTELQQILEAARWAPTAHNMQNFEIVAVDDPALLAEIGAIRATVSAAFLRENYRQLAFSDEELLHRKTGVPAAMFPPAWRVPEPGPALPTRLLSDALRDCPTLLIVVYDPRRRAPASEGDALGLMSLGCVMQSMWLMAEALGIAMQIVSSLSVPDAAAALHRLLDLPTELSIAFACRLGHVRNPNHGALRVRREIGDFVHRNRYGGRA